VVFSSRRRCCYSALALLSGAVALAEDQVGMPHVPRGATIVFYGDSITARGDQADGWIRLIRHRFARDLRRPDIKVVNAGRGGMVAADLLTVLQEPLPRQPHLAVVGIGINDVLRNDGNSQEKSVEEYETILRLIIRRLVQQGSRVLVWPPLVYGESEQETSGKDSLIDAYASVAERVTRAEGAGFVHARSALLAARRSEPANAGNSNKLTVDGLHLNAAGNTLLGDLIYSQLMEAMKEPLGNHVR